MQVYVSKYISSVNNLLCVIHWFLSKELLDSISIQSKQAGAELYQAYVNFYLDWVSITFHQENMEG